MESEPAEITWGLDGITVVYGIETEWWAEKLGTRVRLWGADK
jgi:hypothetical protein